MAVGCVHGNFADQKVLSHVLAFAERFKPEVRFDLGDVADTTAFRSGARGTPDESADPRVDYCAAVDWLERYQPTHIAWGNHDARLVELARHPNGLVSYAATEVWNHMQGVVEKLGAKQVPYDFERGWFEMGGTFWGHGYWYNMQAVRDHAEYLGGPCVIAHLHKPESIPGRTRKNSMSHCVGTLSTISAHHYARRRRATSQWGPGVVFGELCKNEARLWLASGPAGGAPVFPPGL